MIRTINDVYLDLRTEFRKKGIAGYQIEARELVAFALDLDYEEFYNRRNQYIFDKDVQKIEELKELRYSGVPDEVIDAVEAGIKRAGSVTTMLDQGMTPEDMLGQVLGSLGVVFMETTEVSYKCYCDRDRVTSALISLGKKELEEIEQEGKTFPVSCQFCDTIYEFTPEDVRALIDSL